MEELNKNGQDIEAQEQKQELEPETAETTTKEGKGKKVLIAVLVCGVVWIGYCCMLAIAGIKGGFIPFLILFLILSAIWKAIVK